MPLFGRKKFADKRPPERKQPGLMTYDSVTQAMEFGDDLQGPIRLKLGGVEVEFVDGKWITTDTSNSGSDQMAAAAVVSEQQREENRQLREENNLLNIKLNMLLDMLTESKAQSEIYQNHIQQLEEQLAVTSANRTHTRRTK